MRFPPSFLDDIRDRIRISEVVGSRVPFDKKKTNQVKGDYWGCCPFHGEKTPSFHCEDRKGRYHCFGCGVSGDHFRFLTELDGLSFPEAVERLAVQAGLAMPIMDKHEQEREDRKATLFDVMEMAAKFFEDQLQTANGAKARAYLRNRGLAVDIQQNFRLGYAPESRNVLKEYLAAKGATAQQIEACGLVVHGEGIAVSYDRFRDRVMFPIPDARGRVIAFGGRALSANVPAKYLNSPETDLFHKSNVLYNFAQARKPAYDKKQVVAAEGYMDVIALHAAGFKNAMAPLGTALTERQLELLWRVHSEPILCFDGDGAGLKAAYRAVDLALPLLQPGRSVRFAMLPEGRDPDDLIQEAGPEAMQAVLDVALPLADMLWNRETMSGGFDTPERRAELEAKYRQTLRTIANESVRRHYEQDANSRLKQFFTGQNNQGQGGNQRGRYNNSQHNNGYGGRNGKNGRPDFRGNMAGGRFVAGATLLNSKLIKKNTAGVPLREAALVAGLVFHPAVALGYFEEMVALPLSHPASKQIVTVLIDIIADWDSEGDQPTSTQVVSRVQQLGLADALNGMETQLRQNGLWHALASSAFEDARDGWLQAYHLHLRNQTLSNDLRAAERALADNDSQENLERLLQIQGELAKLEGTEAQIEGFGISSGRPARTF